MGNFSITDIETKIGEIIAIVMAASEAVMDIYNSDIKVITKKDGTPVTNADLKSDEIITTGLKNLFPEIFMISEEGYEKDPESFNSIPNVFWLLDPVDGTKNFINKQDDGFSINLGLIVDSKPVFGILCMPGLNETYYSHQGKVCKISKNGAVVMLKDNMSEELCVLISPRTKDDDVQKLISVLSSYERKVLKIPSAVKYCQMLENRNSMIPYFAKTYEWDTAAGHALLNTLGAGILTRDGQELQYGKVSFANPHVVCAYKGMLSDSVLSAILRLL